MPPSFLEKRKALSKTIDTGNLPSLQGHKRPKVDTSIPTKALVIKFDRSAFPVVKTPLEAPTYETPFSRLDPKSSMVPPVEDPTTASHTLLRSESLAWNKFKMVKQEDIMACYDISIKEFERSTILELFKVFSFIYSNLLILLPSHILTFCFAGHVQVYGGV